MCICIRICTRFCCGLKVSCIAALRYNAKCADFWSFCYVLTAFELIVHGAVHGAVHSARAQLVAFCFLGSWFLMVYIPQQQILTRLRRYKALNLTRLQRAVALMHHEARKCLEIVPVLLHYNHINLPGYRKGQVPHGIDLFVPNSIQRQYIEELLSPEAPPLQEPQEHAILGLYAMGSTSSLGQSDSSDVDIWVCVKANIPEEQMRALQDKCRFITTYVKARGVELNLFVTPEDRFTNFTPDSMDEENCGSAQNLFLLDEFYRSSIRLCGRYIIWYLISTKEEQCAYQDYVNFLLHGVSGLSQYSAVEEQSLDSEIVLSQLQMPAKHQDYQDHQDHSDSQAYNPLQDKSGSSIVSGEIGAVPTSTFNQNASLSSSLVAVAPSSVATTGAAKATAKAVALAAADELRDWAILASMCPVTATSYYAINFVDAQSHSVVSAHDVAATAAVAAVEATTEAAGQNDALAVAAPVSTVESARLDDDNDTWTDATTDSSDSPDSTVASDAASDVTSASAAELDKNVAAAGHSSLRVVQVARSLVKSTNFTKALPMFFQGNGAESHGSGDAKNSVEVPTEPVAPQVSGTGALTGTSEDSKNHLYLNQNQAADGKDGIQRLMAAMGVDTMPFVEVPPMAADAMVMGMGMEMNLEMSSANDKRSADATASAAALEAASSSEGASDHELYESNYLNPERYVDNEEGFNGDGNGAGANGSNGASAAISSAFLETGRPLTAPTVNTMPLGDGTSALKVEIQPGVVGISGGWRKEAVTSSAALVTTANANELRAEEIYPEWAYGNILTEDECVQAALRDGWHEHEAPLKADEWFDFGSVLKNSPTEYFGSGLWLLYKAIDSPFKVVLKILLMEAYSNDYPNTQLLSSELKEYMLSHDGYSLDLDSYYLMYLKVSNYLQSHEHESRLLLMRKCFYIKIFMGLNTKNAYHREDYKIKRQLLDKFHKRWGWTKEFVRELESIASWKMNTVRAFNQEVYNTLLESYLALLRFSVRHGIEYAITSDDAGILSRKLYAAFDKYPGKIPVLHTSLQHDLEERDLTFIKPSEYSLCRKGWHLYAAAAHDVALLNTAVSYIGSRMCEVVTWACFNGLLSPRTRTYVVGAPSIINSTKIRMLSSDIRRVLEPACGKVNEESLQRAPRLKACVVALNLEQDDTELLRNSIIDIDDGSTLCCGRQRICLVGSIDLVFVNSWGEIRSVSLPNGEEGVVELLATLLRIMNNSGDEVELPTPAPAAAPASASAISSSVDWDIVGKTIGTTTAQGAAATKAATAAAGLSSMIGAGLAPASTGREAFENKFEKFEQEKDSTANLLDLVEVCSYAASYQDLIKYDLESTLRQVFNCRNEGGSSEYVFDVGRNTYIARAQGKRGVLINKKSVFGSNEFDISVLSGYGMRPEFALQVPPVVDRYATSGIVQYFFSPLETKGHWDIYIINERNEVSIYRDYYGSRASLVNAINRFYTSQSQTSARSEHSVRFNLPQYFVLTNDQTAIHPFTIRG